MGTKGCCKGNRRVLEGNDNVLVLGRNVVETQPATIAEFGSPQTGPNGEPNRALLAAQVRCSGPLRLCSGAAQPRAQGKAATAQGGGPNWSWGKKSYVRLLGYFKSSFSREELPV